MGTGYLLDSNIIIGYLAGAIPAPGMKTVSGIVDNAFHISIISQIEVLRFNDIPENEQILADFVKTAVIHPLNGPVVRRTIALCKQSKIKLPDAGQFGCAELSRSFGCAKTPQLFLRAESCRNRRNRKFRPRDPQHRRFQKYSGPRIT
jgi:hypothetical protein